MNKVAKVIRVLTAPPFLAAALVVILYLCVPSVVGDTVQLCFLLLFLAVMPMLAYPLQPLIPFYKKSGREGQRNLAFVGSLVGYVCGIIFAFVSGATKGIFILYFTYFLSLILLTCFNRLTKWKASGHACGVAGPIIALIWFVGTKAIPAVLVFCAMAWASIRMKRHTVMELILGGAGSVVAFFIVLSIVNNFM